MSHSESSPTDAEPSNIDPDEDRPEDTATTVNPKDEELSSRFRQLLRSLTLLSLPFQRQRLSEFSSFDSVCAQFLSTFYLTQVVSLIQRSKHIIVISGAKVSPPDGMLDFTDDHRLFSI